MVDYSHPLAIEAMADKHGEMNSFDRSLVPKEARVSIPLTHSRDLRRIAKILMLLASELESVSGWSIPERSILNEAWDRVRTADRLIKTGERIK